MSSELLIGRIPGGLVVSIVGRGTMQESVAFRALVEAGLDVGLLVFDATACEYVDSTFLGGLIWIKRACEQTGECKFQIAASAAVRVKLFSASSLDSYFDFLDEGPTTVGNLLPIKIETLDPEELGRHVMHCHELLADMGGSDARAFRAVADRLANELREKSAAESNPQARPAQHF